MPDSYVLICKKSGEGLSLADFFCVGGDMKRNLLATCKWGVCYYVRDDYNGGNADGGRWVK